MSNVSLGLNNPFPLPTEFQPTFPIVNEEAQKNESPEITLDEITGKDGIVETPKDGGRTVAQKIYDIAIEVLLFPFQPIIWCLKKTFKALISLSYFSGFKMDEAIKAKRSEDLINGVRKSKEGEKVETAHKGEKIKGSDGPLTSSVSNLPIDALYIKSGAEKKTGNVILYVLGKDYQAFNPKNYDHLLDDGADVVLFNPSKNTARTMSADLKTIIESLKKTNPDQEIMLHGYCIGAHVAAGVATELAEKENITLPVVVDRGYGDGYKIGRKICALADVPYLKRYVNKHFNLACQKSIQNHKGPMLFVSPTDGDDQMIHKKLKGKEFKNYTKVLYDNHQNINDRFIELKNADHWTPWTYGVHNEVKEFMKDRGIIREDYKKFDEQDTGGFPVKTTVPWMRKHIAPLFLQ